MLIGKGKYLNSSDESLDFVEQENLTPALAVLRSPGLGAWPLSHRAADVLSECSELMRTSNQKFVQNAVFHLPLEVSGR